MNRHNGRIRELKELLRGEVQYQAWCHCNWTGPPRRKELTAEGDAIIHEVTATPME